VAGLFLGGLSGNEKKFVCRDVVLNCVLCFVFFGTVWDGDGKKPSQTNGGLRYEYVF
jgi:hypothetical protein